MCIVFLFTLKKIKVKQFWVSRQKYDCSWSSPSAISDKNIFEPKRPPAFASRYIVQAKKNHICFVNFLHRGGARSLPHFYSRQTLRSTDAKVIEIGFSFQDRGIIVHYGISIKNSPNVISVSLFQPVLSKALAVKSFVRWKECVYSTDKKYWC